MLGMHTRSRIWKLLRPCEKSRPGLRNGVPVRRRHVHLYLTVIRFPSIVVYFPRLLGRLCVTDVEIFRILFPRYPLAPATLHTSCTVYLTHFDASSLYRFI